MGTIINNLALQVKQSNVPLPKVQDEACSQVSLAFISMLSVVLNNLSINQVG